METQTVKFRRLCSVPSVEGLLCGECEPFQPGTQTSVEPKREKAKACVPSPRDWVFLCYCSITQLILADSSGWAEVIISPTPLCQDSSESPYVIQFFHERSCSCFHVIPLSHVMLFLIEPNLSTTVPSTHFILLMSKMELREVQKSFRCSTESLQVGLELSSVWCQVPGAENCINQGGL